ncbi:MAG: MoaD/ThiS family protein [Chloroflexi bacterium]|nr:MoaD/ThiS family protein [Chloroflexota bacterium]
MIGSAEERRPPVISVRIPPVLRDVVDGARQLEVEGATVGEALEALFARFPALRDRLTTDGQLSAFVNVYVNADDVRHRDGLATPLGATDTVILLPAMAGGSGCSGRAPATRCARSR